MQKNKMHADELEIDIPLVRRLLAEQFPQWADLPLKLVLPSGTDHAIYRLGDELSIRLPRIEWASGQGEKEWLRSLYSQIDQVIKHNEGAGSSSV